MAQRRQGAAAGEEAPLLPDLSTGLADMHDDLIGPVRQGRGVDELVACVVASGADQTSGAEQLHQRPLVQEDEDWRRGDEIAVEQGVELCSAPPAYDVPLAEKLQTGSAKKSRLVTKGLAVGHRRQGLRLKPPARSLSHIGH